LFELAQKEWPGARWNVKVVGKIGDKNGGGKAAAGAEQTRK